MNFVNRLFSGLLFSTVGFAVSGVELNRKLNAKEKELVKIYEQYSKANWYKPFTNIKYIVQITEVLNCWDPYEEMYDPTIKNKLSSHLNKECWRITYELPEGYMGGTPVVFIDKKTMQVLHAYGTQ
ncbi:hypothetical protein EHQ12_16470 [Leptospira gomenensis]|uniref:NTF2 fold domain-containing protein n=1 Tax=Leptospira gomenensis TaxID=2484974 RepID=A0A5F1YE51_9LEPT|nr:NTF2 fold immunity protein [Leptospira gomenensis]TGK34323.1 hypothetical protein EHQ12_16470 [Leptospira gomenensis]TGK37315.1 hypothetical protein EHQ17_03790 [Leptospira gomenensis]TGK51002.1 hypothetical protein EHQ07_03855 [Leptospira gomenensis]TGK56624.1 hypothetical protein EHQ13_15780 [Leptospira gomenensis]